MPTPYVLELREPNDSEIVERVRRPRAIATSTRVVGRLAAEELPPRGTWMTP